MLGGLNEYIETVPNRLAKYGRLSLLALRKMRRYTDLWKVFPQNNMIMTTDDYYLDV